MQLVDGIPWFDDGEIDKIMQSELRKAGVRQRVSSPLIDVEKFIESHLDIQPDPRDLPSDVHGAAFFALNGSAEIWVDRTLLDDANSTSWSRHRLRSTLAHEAAHVILHQFLFQGGLQDLSAVGYENTDRVMCRNGGGGYKGTPNDRLEWQANQGMAALLMPKRTFLRLAKLLQRDKPADGELVRALADSFDVSFEAARIRAKDLAVVHVPEA